MNMLLNFFGLLVIALFALVGYMRGLPRMVAALIALVLSGILAQPFAGLGALPLGASVPLIFKPLAGALIAGLVLFILFDFLLGLPISRQQKRRKEDGDPKVAPWEAYTGLAFGTVWGLGILVLVLTGVNAIGRTQRAMRRSDAEVSYRIKHPGPWAQVPDSQLSLAPPERSEEWSSMVEESLFAPLVSRVNPIDGKVEKTLGDLSVVCNDAQLFNLFQQHPKIQAMMGNQVIMGLAQDPEISQLVREGNYRQLMDNPKIAEVARDRTLRQQLKDLHIDQLLEEIRQQSRELPRGR